MKHCIYIILILVLGQCSISSQKTTYTTSPKLEAHIDSEFPYGIPCFTSSKVNTILKQEKDSTYYIPSPISDTSYNSLNNQEKIIYALQYPESYRQICYDISKINKGTNSKIMAELPMLATWSSLSKRQREHLENHKDSTTIYLKNCINQSDYLSQQYKDIILKFHLYECIPTLINKIEQPEQYDPQIVTTLMLFMKYNEYPPFLESKIYEKLYIPKKGEEYIDRKSSIPKSDKKIQEIIGFANAFYQEKMNK